MKTSTKKGARKYAQPKTQRDCVRARNAQGSPKAGARAIFVQTIFSQPPYYELIEAYRGWRTTIAGSESF